MISDPNPNSDSNWAMLGRKYKNEGSFTKAEAAFSRAIELNPKNDVAYEELSLLYRDVGKSDQAIQAVCRAVEINPNNDSAYVKLGVLYNNEGKTVDSEQALSRALEINPKNSDAYMELGWLYQNRRAYQYKFGGPEEVLKKAIELDPQQLQAYIALGRFYRNQKRLSDAERILKAALGVDPDFKFALGELAAIHSQGKNKNFFEVYAENIKDPNNKYHYAVTVNNYHKLKKVLDQRKIKLVCVQYPVQDLYLLKDILGGEIEDGIVFVDNERTFKEAILKEGYEEYFGDKRGGNFGHCTDKGNELLARNIANVIQGEVFNKK